MLDMGTDQNSKEKLILKAAEEEFMQKGFDGAKTTKIAARAGVTHAMLHYYYRTKENLFNKVLDDKLGIMIETIFSSFRDLKVPFLDKIKIAIEAHFDFFVQNPDLPRFVVNELISKPERRKILEDKIGIITGMLLIQLQKEADEATETGLMRKINILDVMIDIASLNLFVFVALPILKSSAVVAYGGEDEFLKARRRENVEMIMCRLRKN